MKTPIKDIFSDDNFKFPDWIRKNSIFKKIDGIDKIYPKIGLNNFSEETSLCSDELNNVFGSGLDLIDDIYDSIHDRIEKLSSFIKKRKISDKRLKNANYIIHAMNSIVGLIDQDLGADNFICNDKDKLTLKAPKHILDIDGKIIFKQGQSLFRIYNKFNSLLEENKFAKLKAIENFESFKKFSSNNVPRKKMLIKFSSSGTEGAWDIATMSMRGISSCQTWDTGGYHYSVIGSMIDPFVGIIYLTSGGKFNEYGSKMIRRCIVRLTVDKETRKPFLFLDNMYPSMDNATIKVFKNILEKKSGLKVKYSYTELPKNSYIPFSKINEILAEDKKQSIQSYQDTKISKKNFESKKDLYDKHITSKLNKLSLQISKIICNDNKNLANKKQIKLSNQLLSDLKGKVDINSFKNSNNYMRKLYFQFFANKHSLLESVLTNNPSYSKEEINNIFNNLSDYFKKKLNKITEARMNKTQHLGF